MLKTELHIIVDYRWQNTNVNQILINNDFYLNINIGNMYDNNLILKITIYKGKQTSFFNTYSLVWYLLLLISCVAFGDTLYLVNIIWDNLYAT